MTSVPVEIKPTTVVPSGANLKIQWTWVKKREKKPLEFQVLSNDINHRQKFDALLTRKENPFLLSKPQHQISLFSGEGAQQIIFQLLPSESSNEINSRQDKEKLLDLSSEMSRRSLKADQVSVDLSQMKQLSQQMNLTSEEFLATLVEGLFLGSYEFNDHKTGRVRSNRKRFFYLIVDNEINGDSFLKDLIYEKKITTQSVFEARHLGNQPPNILDANFYVDWVKKKIKSFPRNLSNRIKFRAFSNAQLKAKGMNAILAVNAGSKKEARLLELEYVPPKFDIKKGKTVLLVGKGVTFDSGGLSLKPAKAMDDMKMDMAGSAAVITSLWAMVKMELNVRVVVLTPITDNMTGGNALKVGDVITTYSGKTVEVLNTDAEGRLILADALSYGIDKYRADYVIDLATLTGACLVALGVYYAGLFSSNEDLTTRLLKSSERAGERLWHLPMDDFFLKELESNIADLKNIGGNYGGASTAAKFLEQFTLPRSSGKNHHSSTSKKPPVPWAHLDIASTMCYDHTKGHQFKGASGFGVRLLIDFVKQIDLESRS